jgi:hypothetical protein
MSGEEPTYPEYAGLRAMAEESVRLDNRFVDPVKMRMLERIGRGGDWRLSVLGHGAQRTLLDLHMLLLAHGQDIVPPPPKWLADIRAAQAAAEAAREEARQARLAALAGEWDALWKALPVPVTVAYNYSGPNHLEGWCQGAVHILVAEGLRAGRLHRAVGDALCTTPSSGKHQLFDGGSVPPDQRWPTCKTCLRAAARLTGLTADVLLSQR